VVALFTEVFCVNLTEFLEVRFRRHGHQFVHVRGLTAVRCC
jgi:hypothetical protein